MKEKELKELLDQYAEEISEWMTEEFKTRDTIFVSEVNNKLRQKLGLPTVTSNCDFIGYMKEDDHKYVEK